MNEKSLDELIGSFLTSAEELKVCNEKVQSRITDIEMALDRQDIKRMPPGNLVGKIYCHDEHDALVKSVEASFQRISKEVHDSFVELSTSLTRKVYSTWVVLIFAFSGIGWVIGTHEKQLYELIKMVF